MTPGLKRWPCLGLAGKTLGKENYHPERLANFATCIRWGGGKVNDDRTVDISSTHSCCLGEVVIDSVTTYMRFLESQAVRKWRSLTDGW